MWRSFGKFYISIKRLVQRQKESEIKLYSMSVHGRKSVEELLSILVLLSEPDKNVNMYPTITI